MSVDDSEHLADGSAPDDCAPDDCGPEDTAPLSPDEERLLDLLSRYEESLTGDSTHIAPAGAEETADLPPELAEELQHDQAFLRDLYQAFEQSAAAERLLDSAPQAVGPGEEDDATRPRAADESPADFLSLFAGTSDSRNPAPRDAAAPTRRVGRFQIVRELGRGGHGVVLLAYDPVLRRHVALKVPRPEVLLDASMRRRFLREARTAARLTHPNLVAVFEVGEIGPICYLASSFCSGPTLASWLSERGVGADPNMAARLVAQLADGIHYAHTQGVLHRDLKPSNVLLEPASHLADDALALRMGESSSYVEQGDSFVPMVTDFGLAKLMESAGDSVRTQTGAQLGTPSYMAPEQAEGRIHEVDRSTDVYALGAVLYEMLIGRPVFRGSNDMHTLHKVLTEEPVPPRKLRRDVSADLEAIILKCLEKQPARRYPTCSELASDLRRYLAGDPTLARPTSIVERAVKWSRRRPAAAALVAVSVLAVAMIAGGSTFYSWQLLKALSTSEKSRVAEAEAREEAELQEKQAIAQRNISDRYLYAARIRQASGALSLGAVNQVTELLAEFDETSRLADLRGFEWHYLKHALHNEKTVLAGHEGQVYGVAYSPDGRTLVSCGQDGTLRLWDAASGLAIGVIRAHSSCANDMAFSPDGRQLASVGCDHALRIRDTATWRETQITCFEQPVLCVEFAPDGRSVACGDSLGYVHVWNLATGHVTNSETLKGAVNAVHWSRDGKELFVAGGPNRYQVCDPESLEILRFRGADRPLTIELSPDGRTLAVSNWRALQIVNPVTLETIQDLGVHTRPIQKMLFTPNGRQLISTGGDNVVKIWNLPNDTSDGANAKLAAAEETAELRNDRSHGRALVGHTDRIQGLALSPDGRTLATAGFDGTARLWDLEARRNWRPEVRARIRIPRFEGSGFPIGLDRNLRKMINLSDDLQLEEWDLDGAQRISSRPLPSALDCNVLPFPDDNRLLAWNTNEQRFYASALEQPDRWRSLNPSPIQLAQYTLSADRKFAATSGDDLAARVWNTRTGETIYSLRTEIKDRRDAEFHIGIVRLALSRHGDKLALLQHNPSGVIDLRSGARQELPVTEDSISSIEFSPDDRYLVCRGESGIVNLIDLTTMRAHYTWRLRKMATAVAFTADCKTLATAIDGEITLWHVATGQELTTLATNSGEIWAMQFSADGRKLAAVTVTDGGPNALIASVYVWSTD